MKNSVPSKTGYDQHRKDNHARNFAILLTVDPVRRTATVLASDQRVLSDLMIIGESGNDGGGDFSTPEPGWHALLTEKLGRTAIECCFPPATYFSEGRPPEYDDYAKVLNTFLSLTSAPGPYRKIENGNISYRAHHPYDLVAGDRGFRTSEGAAVFALRGGVAGIKVDDLCQILLNQVDHLTRIVSRNFDLMTDSGMLSSSNVKGAALWSLTANSAAKNTYNSVSEFTLGLGTNPSGAFIDWSLYSKTGDVPVASYKLDQTGTRHTYLKGDDLSEVGGHQGIGVAGAQKVIVGQDQDIEVDGQHILKCADVNLGGLGGEKAPMGEELLAFLQKLKLFLDTQLMVMTPLGPSTPGAFMFQSPEVPDLLSNVVKYIKDPG